MRATRLAFMTEIELALHRDDDALLVMPMCHANWSISSRPSAIGAVTSIYSRAGFDPEHCVRFRPVGATFTSLVPTHYIMMLGLLRSAKLIFGRASPS